MPYKDKDKARAANRKSYQKYKDKRLAEYKKWRDENPGYSKDYYNKNKEVIRSKQKDYNEKNKENISKNNKKRYEENREERLADRKIYYEENRDEILAKHSIYREGHKEEKTDYMKSYYRIKFNHNRGKGYEYNLALKERQIIATPEELEYMDLAIKSYCLNYKNNKNNTYENIVGDAYLYLLKTIRRYDPNKTSNKKSYIIYNVKLGITQGYKNDVDKHRQRKNLGVSITSLNIKRDTTNSPDEGIEGINLVEEKQQTEDVVDFVNDSNYFAEKIREGFNSLDRLNTYPNDYIYNIWYDINVNKLTYEELGEKIGKTRKQIDNLINRFIKPKFTLI